MAGRLIVLFLVASYLDLLLEQFDKALAIVMICFHHLSFHLVVDALYVVSFPKKNHIYHQPSPGKGPQAREGTL